MKKSHSGLWLGFGVGFAAAIYSLALFLLKPAFDISAWVLYGATLLAFLLMGIQLVASAQKGSGVILSSALGIITTIYFLIQFIFGGIVCQFFSNLPLTPVVVAELVLVALYLLAAFAMNAAQSHSAAQDRNDAAAVRKLRLLESDVQGMLAETSDPQLKAALSELAEAIHFSDPSNDPALADIDGRIAQDVGILRLEIIDPKNDLQGRIREIRKLIDEHNRLAAIRK